MPDLFTEIALFKPTLAEGAVLPAKQAADQHLERQLTSAQKRLAKLLPVVQVNLTHMEAEDVQRHQEANLVMGAVAGASMICAGDDCPVRYSCPLFQIGKAPLHSPCPLENNLISNRFLTWMMEIERTLETLTESERSVISTLTYLDLQEHRLIQNLSRAQNALMESRSVSDVDAEGNIICWEDVVHISQQNLQLIITQRRMLLKDFELTPEQKTRKQKALGLREEDDIARRQSVLFDRLNKRKKAPRPEQPVVIDGTATVV